MKLYGRIMGNRVKAALPRFIIWTSFLLLAIYLISIARTESLESFLMLVFAVFSIVIVSEGVHELSGDRPIGTLKEFSSMSREELSLYNQKRITTVNGILHVLAAIIIFSSLFQRAFITEEFVIVLFFNSLIPVAILLAFGSYWVNYGRFFKTDEGRKVGKTRNIGAAIRTTFSLLVAIGASYGLAYLFMII